MISVLVLIPGLVKLQPILASIPYGRQGAFSSEGQAFHEESDAGNNTNICHDTNTLPSSTNVANVTTSTIPNATSLCTQPLDLGNNAIYNDSCVPRPQPRHIRYFKFPRTTTQLGITRPPKTINLDTYTKTLRFKHTLQTVRMNEMHQELNRSLSVLKRDSYVATPSPNDHNLHTRLMRMDFTRITHEVRSSKAECDNLMNSILPQEDNAGCPFQNQDAFVGLVGQDENAVSSTDPL